MLIVESFERSSAPPGGLKPVTLYLYDRKSEQPTVNRPIEEGMLSRIGIISCWTKYWCEKIAQHVSDEIVNLGSNLN